MTHLLNRWRTVGTWLALLAIGSALLAPVARLNAEVATGKLGALCLASAIYEVAANTDTSGDAGMKAGGDPCHGCAGWLPLLNTAQATSTDRPAELAAAAQFTQRLAQRPAFERPLGRAPPHSLSSLT